MKQTAHTSKFKWGKFDWNDLVHLALGGAVFYAIFFGAIFMTNTLEFDFALDEKWVAFIGTFIVASIWEYSQQWRNHKIQMDLKDIVVTCLVAIISVILL